MMGGLAKSIDVLCWKEKANPIIIRVLPYIEKLNMAMESGTIESLVFAVRDLVKDDFQFLGARRAIKNLPKCSDDEWKMAQRSMLQCLKIYNVVMFFGMNLIQTVTRVANAHHDGETITAKEEKDLLVLRNAMIDNIKEAIRDWHVFLTWYQP